MPPPHSGADRPVRPAEFYPRVSSLLATVEFEHRQCFISIVHELPILCPLSGLVPALEWRGRPRIPSKRAAPQSCPEPKGAARMPALASSVTCRLFLGSSTLPARWARRTEGDVLQMAPNRNPEMVAQRAGSVSIHDPPTRLARLALYLEPPRAIATPTADVESRQRHFVPSRSLPIYVCVSHLFFFIDEATSTRCMLLGASQMVVALLGSRFGVVLSIPGFRKLSHRHVGVGCRGS